MCSIEDEEEVEQTMVDDKKSCADDKEEEDEVKVLYFRPQGQAPSVTSSRGNMETVISLPGLARDQDAGGVEIETTRPAKMQDFSYPKCKEVSDFSMGQEEAFVDAARKEEVLEGWN